MGERTCSVDDCERKANVPGAARGFCGKHYQRWKAHGDPLRERPVVVGVETCSVAQCTAVVKARGWCVKHWTRWHRFGDPETRLRGEVRDGRRICPGCQRDKVLLDFSPSQAYCKECSRARAADYRDRHPYEPVQGSPAECDCCSQAFMADGRRNRYCSPECFDAHRNRANWKHSALRRARLRDAFVESFDRVEIFERDGWICQLCGEQLLRDTAWPDRRFATLDHVVPISRGGEHSRANAQTACLGCNVRKGARLTA